MLAKGVSKLTLKTLRTRLLFLPGELVKADNKPVLKLPANFWCKDTIRYTLIQVEK